MDRKILIVEDERLFAQLLSDALMILPGIHVDVAANGQEGLKALESGEYDLIFTDIHMPEMNGEDFLKAVRSQNDTIGIFVLTAHVQENYVRQFNVLGIEDYLDKSSCDLGELRKMVREYFRRQDIELMSESIL